MPTGPDEASPFAPAQPEPSGRSAHLNASTHIERGWNLISRGEHAAAEEELAKALALVPDDTQAASLSGWAQMLQGKYDDALLHFNSVLHREPAHAIARVNVGYICLKKEIYGEAIEHLSRVIRESDDRKATLYAHFYLGQLYAAREMFTDAEAFSDARWRLVPTSSRRISSSAARDGPVGTGMARVRRGATVRPRASSVHGERAVPPCWRRSTAGARPRAEPLARRSRGRCHLAVADGTRSPRRGSLYHCVRPA